MAKLTDLAIAQLQQHKAVSVISGMALGWDTALAEAALKLGLPLFAYVPFHGQESRWPYTSQVRYRQLLAKAEDIILCSTGGFSAAAMQVRNERMVDDCDLLLALWSGAPGGTANCVEYARRKRCPVANCWDAWTQ